MVEQLDDAELKSHLEKCIDVLNEYSWLLDSYVLDFFTENHMKKLPNSWQNYLKRIPLEDFYYLMNLSVGTRNIWPLSIICLRVLIRFLQLPRKLNGSYDISLKHLNEMNSTVTSELYKIKSACFEHPKLKNYFLKHLKPKKRYEIFRMATTAADIANHLNVKYVVDVGSGLGHLSRIMAYGFNLNVCSIESQSQLTKRAQIIDCEFEKIASKHLSEVEFKYLTSKRPLHLNHTIRFNLSAINFVKKVKEALSVNENNFKFGIIGLHPCGDLAAILLKFYADCSEAVFITLVGCCYHKLSTSSDSKCQIGFPLTHICAHKGLSISHEARALACHAIESYRERLISKNFDYLKVHCYRAALENIISKNWPEHRKSALGSVKFGPELTFREYCQLALKKLHLKVSEEDLKSEETLKNLANWEDVAKFYSLRIMLAPLIETIILLDRKIFLLEKGFRCKIKTAFDPQISPRNQLLISEKII